MNFVSRSFEISADIAMHTPIVGPRMTRFVRQTGLLDSLLGHESLKELHRLQAEYDVSQGLGDHEETELMRKRMLYQAGEMLVGREQDIPRQLRPAISILLEQTIGRGTEK